MDKNLKCKAASGIAFIAQGGILELAGGIDTVLIPGGMFLNVIIRNATVLAWLRSISRDVRRLGAVGAGVYILAAAGVLDGRTVTTHWQDCEQLAKQHPANKVRPNQIYVKDGAFYTCAGATAGIDMALAFVKQDLGRELALRVAQMLVMLCADRVARAR